MDRIVVYNKVTGLIDAVVPNLSYSDNYSEDIKQNLEVLDIKDIPENVFDYKVVEYELVKITSEEKLELSLYGKFLTDEERFEINMLERLQPSYDEIKKAENTIEILELLLEVL